jgi:Uma2 family endonuclease
MSTESSAPVSSAEYERLALADPEGNLELHRGRLRRKPGMTMEHNHIAFRLGHLLASQLSARDYHVRVNAGRARHSRDSYYIPDVMVIPAAMALALRNQPDRLESYAEPLPLVVEVWSPSTGDYDASEKLDEYRSRGDEEIWLVHPYERTVRAWRRHPGSSGPDYNEVLYGVDQVVTPSSLPSVQVDLRELFALD